MEKRLYNKSHNEEKRMHPRSPYFMNISYRQVSEDNDKTTLNGKGITQNISYAGMCLLLNKELPLGTILELKFDHTENDPNPIVTRVKIVWLKKTDSEYLAGVKFLV